MGLSKLVQRRQYLDWLDSWREKQVIKVVSGVRRCGKSTLFRLFIENLIEKGVSKEQIVVVNLEKLENENLLDYRSLYDHIMARLVPEKYTYVFVDEVQRCKHFEKRLTACL